MVQNTNRTGMGRVEELRSLRHPACTGVAVARWAGRAAQSASQTMGLGPLTGAWARYGKPSGSTVEGAGKRRHGVWWAVVGDPSLPGDGEEVAVEGGGLNGSAAANRRLLRPATGIGR